MKGQDAVQATGTGLREAGAKEFYHLPGLSKGGVGGTIPPRRVGQLRRRRLLSLNCLWQEESFGPVSQASRTAPSTRVTGCKAGSSVTGRGPLA